MKLFLAALLFLSLPSLAVKNTHCPTRCTSGTSNGNYIVARDAYILSNNPTTKFADWVAYTVTKNTIDGSRKRNWKADPDIFPSRTLEPDDYKYAHASIGTDRGHQAPLASLTGYKSWRELNYLSNITPQRSELNQGAWNRLEGKVRKLALRRDVGKVYVVTGPLYEYSFAKLPNADERAIVPSGYWKVIYWNNGSTIKTAAFMFDQLTPRDADFCAHSTTINDVEYHTGFNIHPYLKNTVESHPGRLLEDLGC